jgi:hypothetical protein
MTGLPDGEKIEQKLFWTFLALSNYDSGAMEFLCNKVCLTTTSGLPWTSAATACTRGTGSVTTAFLHTYAKMKPDDKMRGRRQSA